MRVKYLLWLPLFLLMGTGCHTGLGFARSSSALPAADKESIHAVLVQWKEATLAKDIDKLLLLYSDKFEHYAWGNKAGFTAFLKDTKGMGYLDKPTVNFDSAKVVASAKMPGAVEAYPIDMTAKFGTARIGLVLKKEGIDWKIVGMSVEAERS